MRILQTNIIKSMQQLFPVETAYHDLSSGENSSECVCQRATKYKIFQNCLLNLIEKDF